MEINVLERFRFRLGERRQNLSAWLSAAPPWKKRMRLGPLEESAAQAHLQVLDAAIDQAGRHTLGRCEICQGDVEPGLLEMDYTCCVCLDHLSPEEKRRLEGELELATKVQQALLPGALPDIPGIEAAAFSRPSDIVGGDFFDFHRFRDGGQGLVIGDAVGHGLSAGLLIANLQASLSILVPDNDDPAPVIRRLNQLFYHNIRMTNFVTLFLAHFDPHTQVLTYTNAGHNPPLLVHGRPNGQGPVTWLEPTGAAIGLVEAFAFDTVSVPLAPGDTLFLYTDGLTEATNPAGEEFGPARLAGLVQEHRRASASELVQAVRSHLETFTAGRPLADDTTLMAWKIT